jgi:hypothetical protein
MPYSYKTLSQAQYILWHSCPFMRIDFFPFAGMTSQYGHTQPEINISMLIYQPLVILMADKST